jgi:hypothetical protein
MYALINLSFSRQPVEWSTLTLCHIFASHRFYGYVARDFLFLTLLGFELIHR